MGGLKTAVNIAPAMDMAPLEVTLPTFLTPPLTLASLKLSWLTLSQKIVLCHPQNFVEHLFLNWNS